MSSPDPATLLAPRHNSYLCSCWTLWACFRLNTLHVSFETKPYIHAVHIIFILMRLSQEDCFVFGKTLLCKPALCWAHPSFHAPSQGSYLSAVIYSLMQHFPILWDNNHEAFKFQLSRAGVQRGCGLRSKDNGNLRQGTPVQGPPGRKATSFSLTFPSP